MLKLAVSREEAEKQIQAQIEKGGILVRDLRRSREVCIDLLNACVRWSRYNQTLLMKAFGEYIHDYECFDPNEFEEFDIIHDSDEGVVRMEASINSLEGICERLELYDEPSQPTNMTQHSFGNDVFIVHGRDDGAKEAVARFVEGLGMNAIILHEQPSRGETIIEKIESYSDSAGFAIVLITPDDVGGLESEADDEQNPRARQNVIFELGYFMGKLGREKVCPLFKGDVENPSDIDGIVYIDMDSRGAWKAELQREMSVVIQEIPDE